MATPILHILAGPNGAGKSTFFAHVLGPLTSLAFVNADVLAAERWPADPASHAYDAADLATQQRTSLLAQRTSFVTETVFSHPSKLDLIRDAMAAGYYVQLHVILAPVDLAVARVGDRVAQGGHDVPEDKIRTRYARLWDLVAAAFMLADEAHVYDNSHMEAAFRVLAVFRRGVIEQLAPWPVWTPSPLRRLAP